MEDYQEIMGVNDRKHLANAYEILQERLQDHWMRSGVTLVDPASITIDETVQIDRDVIIEPQTHLRGNTVIRSGAKIGPGSLILVENRKRSNHRSGYPSHYETLYLERKKLRKDSLNDDHSGLKVDIYFLLDKFVSHMNSFAGITNR